MMNSTTTTSTMIKNIASARKKYCWGEGGEGRMPFTRDYFFSAENVTKGLPITTIFASRRTTVRYAKVKKQTPALLSLNILWPVQGT